MKKYVIEKGCIKRYERVVIFTKTFENCLSYKHLAGSSECASL